MANTISPYFTDEELEQSLMMQFSEEEMYTMDYRTVFNQIEDIGECLQLRLRGRKFNIDKMTGMVEEVEKA